jgi:hypothetical protein
VQIIATDHSCTRAEVTRANLKDIIVGQIVLSRTCEENAAVQKQLNSARENLERARVADPAP